MGGVTGIPEWKGVGGGSNGEGAELLPATQDRIFLFLSEMAASDWTMDLI